MRQDPEEYIAGMEALYAKLLELLHRDESQPADTEELRVWMNLESIAARKVHYEMWPWDPPRVNHWTVGKRRGLPEDFEVRERTHFYGERAKERAKEYMDWKNSFI